MPKIYKTAQGQSIDMDHLILRNETTLAIGNMNTNARGDQVANDGTIIKNKQDVMKEYYRHIEPVVKYNPKKR